MKTARALGQHAVAGRFANARDIDELKRLGSQLGDAPFVCGGSVDPLPRGPQAEGVSEAYSDPQGQHPELVFPPHEPTDLDRLVAACEPATFGRGDQDVLDPTYRQAVKLDPGRFTTSLNLAEFPILAEIQRVIGGGGTVLRAVTHKLNVYTKGGFFKAHKDTPRNANTIGTLVVCLPTQFEGGEFVVKSADGSFTHTFDWGSGAAANGKVQWCAFYSDCEHEVLPVRAGHRVTLTYVLEHVPIQHPTLVDAQPFTAFGDRLGALLKDPSFAPQGVKLGFGLTHQYIVTKQHGTRRETGASTPDADHVVVRNWTVRVPLLKDADRVLKETLDRLGLQYECVPVYEDQDHRRREGYGRTYNGVEVPEPSEWRFPFRTAGEPAGAWRGDGDAHLYVSDWGDYLSASENYDYGEPQGLDFSQLKLFKSREVVWVVRPTNFPYVKTSILYGNEHSLGHYYTAACLLVYVPPSDARGATTQRD